MRQRLFGTRRRRVLSVVIAAALIATGTAVAQWLVTSSNGKGYGKIGTAASPVINTQASPSYGTACLAGGNCDLTMMVTNPNGTSLTITGIAAGLGSDESTSDPSGCPFAGNLSLNTSGVTFTPTTIPANSSGTLVTAVGAEHLSSNAPSACQGVTFTEGVKLTLSTP